MQVDRHAENYISGLPAAQGCVNVEGANPWQLFREVIFPLAGRALVSGATLTWSRATGKFGASALPAGNLEETTQTRQMAIYLASSVASASPLHFRSCRLQSQQRRFCLLVASKGITKRVSGA